jgi:hypothetical protein
MYVKFYPEMLTHSASVGAFVRTVWEFVGGRQRSIAHDPVRRALLYFPRPRRSPTIVLCLAQPICLALVPLLTPSLYTRRGTVSP